MLDAAGIDRGVPQCPVAACARVEMAEDADRLELAESRDQGTTGGEALADAQTADRPMPVVPTAQHRWRPPPVAVWASQAVPREAPGAERPAAQVWSAAAASALWDAVPQCASESSAARHAQAPELLRARAPAEPQPPVLLAQARRPVLRPAVEAVAARPPRAVLQPRPLVPAQAAALRREQGQVVLRRQVRAAPRRQAARLRRRASRFLPGAVEAAPGRSALEALAPSSRAPASCLSEPASRRKCRQWAA